MKKKLCTISILWATTVAYADYDDANMLQKSWHENKISWQQVEEQAKKEGEVNWYHWGGSQQLNSWIDNILKPKLAEKGINLNNIPLVDTRDAVDIVQKDNVAGRRIGEGNVDLIWINGDNFAYMKSENLVFGAFANKLPNSKNFEFNIEDPRSLNNTKDLGVDTDYTEIPWGMEQYTCYADRSRLKGENTPRSYDDLAVWLKENPGRFTYVRPPHYLGNTFVQSTLYGKSGENVDIWQKSAKELNVQRWSKLMKPGFEYLREIEPYLLGGRGAENDYKRIIYAENNANLQSLYSGGEIDMACEMGMFLPANLINDGTFSKTTETVLFPSSGQLRNKNYLVIPNNTPNPAAALVLADLMSSVEMQASKVKFLGYPIGIDAWKLTKEEQQMLKDVTPELPGVTLEMLDNIATPDINASLVPIISKVWEEYIGKHSDVPFEEIVQKTYDETIK